MKILRNITVLLLLAVFCSGMTGLLHVKGITYNLTSNSNETDNFRSMYLDDESFYRLIELKTEANLSMSQLLAVWMSRYQFDLRPVSAAELSSTGYTFSRQLFETHSQDNLTLLENSYLAVWGDLLYFPVPDSESSDETQTGFENSWMAERSYGGKRGHEGCDVMPSKNQRDVYPVVSMTEGVVENIGWLKKGGYRIGIRAPHGAYFYYAHLSSYGNDFKIGDKIQAGELLGYMGDTGYSEVEGTTGNFDVHLHLGIYIRTANQEELSVNPYWILRSLESHKLKYAYKV